MKHTHHDLYVIWTAEESQPFDDVRCHIWEEDALLQRLHGSVPPRVIVWYYLNCPAAIAAGVYNNILRCAVSCML